MGLDQVPQIPVEIFKYEYLAVGLTHWSSNDLDVICPQSGFIRFDVIGVQEKKNASPGLITHASRLMLIRSLG